jgi:DNA repair exonuclease SbcCD ATPase subunit
MIPKRISLKNFLSFGEPAVVFTFKEDEPLWVLRGPNGVGKSAVFDAITYALYGRHRGGEQKAEQLVRHGTNGFEIEFDFEFNGIDYRIRRTRPRQKGGRTTQHLLKFVEGEPKPVRGNDPAGAVTADGIKEWVIGTIGLPYEAFTNSVLLRQGEADKLFSASRDDRIKVLKGIIGFEQFEALSGRVHAAADQHKRAAEGLASQLENCEPVTDEAIGDAEKAVEAREVVSRRKKEEWEKAVERVGHAKQWEKLEKRRKELEGWLKEAKARAKEEQHIRAANDRLEDLTRAVPALEALFKVRGRITGLRQGWDAARCALRAIELARDIKHDERLLIEVSEAEHLEARLKEYPEDLDAQVEGAIDAERKAGEDASKAAEAKTRAETLRDKARERQQEFADVTVGIPCSRCGQRVNEAYAAEERARLADEVKTRQAEFETKATAATEAAARLTTFQEHRKKLDGAKRERARLGEQREAKRQYLSAWSEATTAAELRARLMALREQKAEAEGRSGVEEDEQEPTPADAKRLDTERKKLDGQVAVARKKEDDLKSDFHKVQGEEKTTLDRLPGPWKERLPSLDSCWVAELAAERNRLIADQIAEKFKALEQDVVRRTGWDEQLAAVRDEISGIPADGRIPEPEAVERQSVAQAAAEQATNDHAAAERCRDDLTRQKKKHDQLTNDYRGAAERQRLHEKLDDLLGQSGIQRELVRDAEEQIVAFANETLQRLSDGDLALEEDTDPESTRAFDLRVRRAGGEPIAVAFLSGSQRFRVAVSIALAVGRFASGRARRLEGVVVDEGFGSLDRDGLRAMAEELKRLQRESALRRVVLVSHQPEFTDHFSVGYELAADKNGTTATPFPR